MTAGRTEWLHRSMLLGSSVAGGLLLSELALRLLGIGYPVFSRPDDERGWVLRAGARGRYETEGSALVEINRDGLRDRDHSRAKPAGTLRIAVLGDSYTEALQVPVAQTFWSVLERELARSAGRYARRVEVMNFGVNGYGTAQELLTLRCCVWTYSPDVVLLAFYSGNDVSDNSRTLDRSPTRYARPYLTATDTGWSIDRSFHGSWSYRAGKIVGRLIAHSRLLQIGNRAQNLMLRRRVAVPVATEGWIGQGVVPDHGIYRETDDTAWSTAWRTTEDLMTTMAREASEHGARFAVVSVTNSIQIYPDSAVRERVAHQLGVPDLLLPGRRIHTLGERLDVPVLDLVGELETYADRHGAFLHGSANTAPGVGHWNALGHRLAGEAIAAWMAGWLPGR
jgi:hypothetical protein